MSPNSIDAVKCCQKEGVPSGCWGFCFNMPQKGLTLRLGPCEKYKAEIDACETPRNTHGMWKKQTFNTIESNQKTK